MFLRSRFMHILLCFCYCMIVYNVMPLYASTPLEPMTTLEAAGMVDPSPKPHLPDIGKGKQVKRVTWYPPPGSGYLPKCEEKITYKGDGVYEVKIGDVVQIDNGVMVEIAGYIPELHSVEKIYTKAPLLRVNFYLDCVRVNLETINIPVKELNPYQDFGVELKDVTLLSTVDDQYKFQIKFASHIPGPFKKQEDLYNACLKTGADHLTCVKYTPFQQVSKTPPVQFKYEEITPSGKVLNVKTMGPFSSGETLFIHAQGQFGIITGNDSQQSLVYYDMFPVMNACVNEIEGLLPFALKSPTITNRLYYADYNKQRMHYNRYRGVLWTDGGLTANTPLDFDHDLFSDIDPYPYPKYKASVYTEVAPTDLDFCWNSLAGHELIHAFLAPSPLSQILEEGLVTYFELKQEKLAPEPAPLKTIIHNLVMKKGDKYSDKETGIKVQFEGVDKDSYSKPFFWTGFPGTFPDAGFWVSRGEGKSGPADDVPDSNHKKSIVVKVVDYGADTTTVNIYRGGGNARTRLKCLDSFYEFSKGWDTEEGWVGISYPDGYSGNQHDFYGKHPYTPLFTYKSYDEDPVQWAKTAEEHYYTAACFWRKIEEKYGTETFLKVMSAIEKARETFEILDLRKVLYSLTGEDLAPLMQTFGITNNLLVDSSYRDPSQWAKW